MDREPTMEELDAAIRGLDQSLTDLRAIVRDAEASEPRFTPEDHAWALRLLLETRQAFRADIPRSLEILVDVAVLDPEKLPTGMTLADRQQCRAMLVLDGLLTMSELRSFPRASLQAIALQRYRRWEETGDARGP
jgi:hypothetical protein